MAEFLGHNIAPGTTSIVDVTLGGASLSPSSSWRRIPPRSLEDQQPGYQGRFDYDTIFYDVFRVEDHVEFIGPPLLNLAQGLHHLEVRCDDLQLRSSFSTVALDRLQRYEMAGVPAAAKTLRFECELGAFELKIGDDLAAHFSERRVLVTQSRDNPLTWIHDWADHHVNTQGIDAVILYDNSSSIYSTTAIIESLVDIAGLDVLAVVSWPYPFGVTGGPSSIWDSDYGQHGCWEHAWRRLARTASTITFGDVDELVVGPPPSVSDRALANPLGICSYARRAILGLTAKKEPGHLPRHLDYSRYDPRASLLSPKYTVSPSMLTKNHQLMVHRVAGLSATPEEGVLARHFDALRMNWRDDTNQAALHDNISDDIWRNTVEDMALRAAFEQWSSTIKEC